MACLGSHKSTCLYFAPAIERMHNEHDNEKSRPIIKPAQRRGQANSPKAQVKKNHENMVMTKWN